MLSLRRFSNKNSFIKTFNVDRAVEMSPKRIREPILWAEGGVPAQRAHQSLLIIQLRRSSGQPAPLSRL